MANRASFYITAQGCRRMLRGLLVSMFLFRAFLFPYTRGAKTQITSEEHISRAGKVRPV
jgi:hypothetical protein